MLAKSTRKQQEPMMPTTWAHLDQAVFTTPITSGIYRLYNRRSDKCYVGQASNLRRRLGNHLTQLKQCRHAQPILRLAFAKHGPECWTFEVLEICDRTRLTERERHHVGVHGALACGYNCAPIQSGVEVTDGFRKIASDAANKFHARTSDEERSAIARKAAATRRERKAAARRSEAARKAWTTRNSSSNEV